MAKIDPKAQLTFSVDLELTETEARLLAEFSRFGHKEVREILIKNLGSSYIAPHASAFESLWKTFAKLHAPISEINRSRAIINQAMKEARSQG